MESRANSTVLDTAGERMGLPEFLDENEDPEETTLDSSFESNESRVGPFYRARNHYLEEFR